MTNRTDPLSVSDPRQTEPTGWVNGARVARKVTTGAQGISKAGSRLVSDPDSERGAFLEGNDRGTGASIYLPPSTSGLGRGPLLPSSNRLGHRPFKAKTLGSNPTGSTK